MRLSAAFIFLLSSLCIGLYSHAAKAGKTSAKKQNTLESSSKKKRVSRSIKKSSRGPSSAASQRPTKRPSARSLNQVSNADLNQSIDSVEELLDTLPGVCQGNDSLAQKTEKFQKKLVNAKKQLRQIKTNFAIRDPSLFSYINTLDFYLNQPQDFNYEKKIPNNGEDLREYISNLTFSFQLMYRVAFNIPENTPADKFPEGWGRSIGAALVCLKNY